MFDSRCKKQRFLFFSLDATCLLILNLPQKESKRDLFSFDFSGPLLNARSKAGWFEFNPEFFRQIIVVSLEGSP